MDSFNEISDVLTFPIHLWICSCRSAFLELEVIRNDYWRGVDDQTSQTLGKSRRERRFQNGAPGVGVEGGGERTLRDSKDFHRATILP